MYRLKIKNQEIHITEIQKKCLDTLVFLFRKYKLVYVSQTKIGEITGYCRQMVNYAVKDLHTLGLIEKTNRGANKTCLYAIPKFMLNKKFRLLHAAILTTLLWSDLAFSKYIQKQLSAHITTGIDNRNIYIQKEGELLGLTEEKKSFYEMWATTNMPERRSVFDRSPEKPMRNLTEDELYWKKVNKKTIFDDVIPVSADCRDTVECRRFMEIIDEAFSDRYPRRITDDRQPTTCVGLDPLPGGKGCIGTTVCTCLPCLLKPRR